MKTLTNIQTTLSNLIFSSTGFNYESRSTDTGNGTESIEFDSIGDAIKFEKLYSKLA